MSAFRISNICEALVDHITSRHAIDTEISGLHPLFRTMIIQVTVKEARSAEYSHQEVDRRGRMLEQSGVARLLGAV